MRPDTEPVVINMLYGGSDRVAVESRGERASATVVVTDKTTGNVTELPLNDAWYLADEVGQAVRRAMLPQRTPEEDAPFSGTCPTWCEGRNGHWFGPAWMGIHFARRGEVEASAHVEEGEVLRLDVELFQECVGDEPPCVSVYAEWPDGALKLTADEAEQLGRKLLEASAEMREIQARERVSGRELASSAA